MHNDKPLIAIGLSFYEDASCLGHCLSSIFDNSKLQDYVKVLAIDGVYKGYPSKNPLSEDGSRELILSFKEKHPDAIELYDFPRLHERFKRQKYVDIAASQGIPFLLILDSDEYIECKNVDDFLEELKMLQDVWVDRNKVIQDNIDNDKVPTIPHPANVYHIKCADLDHLGYVIHTGHRPRLWYNFQNMMYSTHAFFQVTRDDKGKLFDPSQHFTRLFVLQNMQIWHDPYTCRSEDREARGKYYKIEKLPALEKK